MAIYGAPVAQDDHPLRACLTATKMLKTLYDLREGWRKKVLPLIKICVGINTGDLNGA